MRGRCYVELNDAGEIIRIFRTPGAARISPSWDKKLVIEYPRRDAVAAIRKRVFDRSKNQCEDCGGLITWNFHMDERIPRGKGGEYSLENCRALCAGCHIVRPDSAHGSRRPRFGEKN